MGISIPETQPQFLPPGLGDAAEGFEGGVALLGVLEPAQMSARLGEGSAPGTVGSLTSESGIIHNRRPTMTLPDFLTGDADGDIYLKGHRIGLQDVVHFYNEGYSPEQLLEAFPTLSLALIHKIVAFYLENRAEVDAYVSQHEAEMERQRAGAVRGPDAAELRRRLEAKAAARS
jgi:uncharacterized protein (DUF433 family)